MLKHVLTGVWLLSAVWVSQLAGQTLVDAKTSTGVSSNEPVDEATSFAVGQDAYCWIKVSDATVGDHITIEWYLNDEKVGSFDLDLKYASMRTYAYRTISAAGNWRADVKKSDGSLLKSLSFTATAGAEVKPMPKEKKMVDEGSEKKMVDEGSEKKMADGGGLVTIESAKLGTGVENNEVVGESTTFSATTEHVYCWIKVGKGQGQVINLVWYNNDAKLGEYSLPELKYDGMRTYGYRTIGNRVGSWRVDMVGPDGAILKSLSFTVE